MSSVIYAVVFKGEVTEGSQLISVKAHMAKLLKANTENMAVLFSGKQVVIKKTTSKQEAIKYGTALKKIGADVKVKVVKQDAGKPASSKSATASATATKTAHKKPAAASQRQQTGADTPAFDLKPNEGNIFDPEPEKVAPALDLGNYSVGENDGSLLVEPKPVERVNLDLSEYEVNDNDGSPLVEPSPVVPKRDAPDFGLDEPGALLEPLKEDKEPVNPDISGMKLTDQQGDILSPDEKDNAPPPRAPDTSNIKLVPNSDP